MLSVFHEAHVSVRCLSLTLLFGRHHLILWLIKRYVILSRWIFSTTECVYSIRNVRVMKRLDIYVNPHVLPRFLNILDNLLHNVMCSYSCEYHSTYQSLTTGWFRNRPIKINKLSFIQRIRSTSWDIFYAHFHRIYGMEVNLRAYHSPYSLSDHKQLRNRIPTTRVNFQRLTKW